MIEVWTASVHVPGKAVEVGVAAEAAGFDGVSFGDTQHVAADPYAGLCMVARETDRLRLMVGVTNPVTRHPAVTAAAIASVQMESKGRAVLGIGRGDSSLAHLGLPPAPVARLTDYLDAVQSFLGGEPSNQQTEGIGWIARTGLPKVPVDVAATGPRTITTGAQRAERVTVNVGAQPERVAWALDVARQAQAASAWSQPLSLGAYLVVAPNNDLEASRDLARGCLGAYAHFSGMSGSPVELLAPQDRAVVEAVAGDYDLANHGQRRARHVAHLDNSFVDRFGIVGTPATCVDRLSELIGLGLDRIVMVEGRDPARAAEGAQTRRLLSEEILPALRELPSAAG